MIPTRRHPARVRGTWAGGAPWPCTAPRPSRFLFALGLTVALLLLAFPLRAALTSSALTGRVTVGERVAADVTVTLMLREAQITRTTTTNGRGTYWFGALQPGVYDVSFSRSGTTSLTRPVTIELGRVARADARLEASVDEESVTSTAITVSVANTTAVTTHFTAEDLERIPLRREVRTAEVLSPVLPNNETIVDHNTFEHPELLGEDLLDEITVVRGAQPIELDRFGSSVILARTHSGTDTFAVSLRDTYSTNDGGGHVLESTSGGRIVPERLWFFGAGWGGDATDAGLRRLRGYSLKLDAQAGPSHHFTASHIDAEAREIESTATSLHYTGVLHERVTVEAIAGRDETIAAKLAYRIADHLVSLGGNSETDAIHLSDRWASGRWAVDAGVRHQDEQTLTRVALAFDLRSSQGSHAIVANWGEYLDESHGVLRVAGIGYTSSLESQGTARIDVFRTEGARVMDQVQADAHYRLFDRFEAGGSYLYTRSDDASLPEHLASARVGVQIPFAGHELAAMALERYDTERWTTDFGVRYFVPFRRVALTFAGDATNVFRDAEFRLWLRIRH